MTEKELKKANELSKKISELSWFLEHTMYNRPTSYFRILMDKLNRSFVKASGYGALEGETLELTKETMAIVRSGLEYELGRLKDEFSKLGKERASEKDIPKTIQYKNLRGGDIYMDIYSCKCPTCNHEWRTMEMSQSRCMECGQKLHWQQTNQKEGEDDNES